MSAWLFILIALLVTGLALVAFTARVASRVAASLPPTGRFIDLPEARLHVLDQGAGPAILLIHGLGGQHRHFTYAVAEALADRFRVVVVDRPGSGYSSRPAEAAASLSAQADVMAALITTLGLDRPVVVGHSLGGGIALALAQRHPQQVGALALIAPLTHLPRVASAAFKGIDIPQPWLRTLIAWTLALPMAILRREAILGEVFGPDPVPDDYPWRGGGLLGVRPSHFVAACADLAASGADLPDMAQRYAAMRVPIEVLYGRDDRILDPVEQGEALVAAVPGAGLTLVPGGHMLPITAPAQTLDTIRRAAARRPA